MASAPAIRIRARWARNGLAAPVCTYVSCSWISPFHLFLHSWPNLAILPVALLKEEVLAIDELEALRLADHLGLYQEEAASRMHVSRQTFGRIVESARRKVADALVNGKALKIKGGAVAMTLEKRRFLCSDCGHAWEIPYGTGRPAECPSCRSANIHRDAQGRGFGRWCRGGRGRGWGRPET